MGRQSVTTGEGRYPAIGSRLRGVPEIRTLGVKPNFLDYTPEERTFILNSELVLYPTKNYAEYLSTMGKAIFPSLETYLYADEKIKQTTLFYMLNIPHPQTRFFYRRHHGEILNHFQYPFIGKLPRSSARGRGVFLIRNDADLTDYLAVSKIAYIQEHIPHERDLRVVLISYQPVIAYWRIRRKHTFKTNLSQGGEISFDRIPKAAILAAQNAASKCRFNDVGMDLIHHRGEWLIIEANMKYGRKGLKKRGLELKEILRTKLMAGELF